MKGPTQEQIERFWEWCGFTTGKEIFGIDVTYYEGNEINLGLNKYPPIDLNNLFKYAVPKLEGFPTVKIQQLSYGQWLARINAGEKYVEEDPALALFWALDKVREGES